MRTWRSCKYLTAFSQLFSKLSTNLPNQLFWFWMGYMRMREETSHLSRTKMGEPERENDRWWEFWARLVQPLPLVAPSSVSITFHLATQDHFTIWLSSVRSSCDKFQIIHKRWPHFQPTIIPPLMSTIILPSAAIIPSSKPWLLVWSRRTNCTTSGTNYWSNNNFLPLHLVNNHYISQRHYHLAIG